MESLERLKSALADRYTVERMIGAGGMADVYLTHDVRHNRKVAIKVMHRDLAELVGVERFLREIETTAKLQHPHILPLLDSGQVESRAGSNAAESGLSTPSSVSTPTTFLYYVMPVVAGETLRARLERERQLPVDDAVRIAAGGAVQACVGRIRLTTDQPREALPGIVHLRGDDEVAIARREDTVDGALRQVVPGLHRQFPAAAQQAGLVQAEHLKT